MTALSNIKALLAGKFQVNGKKISVYDTVQNVTEMNCIRLFYTGLNDFVSNKSVPYFSIGIQVTVRFNDYDIARLKCFEAHEYIRTNQKTQAGYYWIPDSVPRYLGVDDVGGYVWGFTISSKGGT